MRCLPFFPPGPVLPVVRASRRAVCVHRQLQRFLHRAGRQQHGGGVSPPAQRDYSWLWWGEEAVVSIMVIKVIALIPPGSFRQSLIWSLCLEGLAFFFFNKLKWVACSCWQTGGITRDCKHKIPNLHIRFLEKHYPVIHRKQWILLRAVDFLNV